MGNITRRLERLQEAASFKTPTTVIKPAKNTAADGDDGFAVFVKTPHGLHRPQIGMGEENWFPDKKEAQKYADEIKKNKHKEIHVKKKEKVLKTKDVGKLKVTVEHDNHNSYWWVIYGPDGNTIEEGKPGSDMSAEFQKGIKAAKKHKDTYQESFKESSKLTVHVKSKNAREFERKIDKSPFTWEDKISFGGGYVYYFDEQNPDALEKALDKIVGNLVQTYEAESFKEGANDEIRKILRGLEAKKKIKKGEYDQKGIQIKWNDGDISGTTDTGQLGLNWLKGRLKAEFESFKEAGKEWYVRYKMITSIMGRPGEFKEEEVRAGPFRDEQAAHKYITIMKSGKSKKSARVVQESFKEASDDQIGRWWNKQRSVDKLSHLADAGVDLPAQKLYYDRPWMDLNPNVRKKIIMFYRANKESFKEGIYEDAITMVKKYSGDQGDMVLHKLMKKYNKSEEEVMKVLNKAIDKVYMKEGAIEDLAAEVMKKATTDQKKVLNDMPPGDERLFLRHIRKPITAQSIDHALMIEVNSVEGDVTQLSSELAKYARRKGWLKGFESVSNRLENLKENLTSYGFKEFRATSLPDSWRIPEGYNKEECEEAYKTLVNERGFSPDFTGFESFAKTAKKEGLLKNMKEKLKLQINKLEGRMDNYYFNENKRADKKINMLQGKLNKLYKEMAILTESHIKCGSNYHAISVQRMLRGSDIEAEVKGDKVFFPKSAEPTVISTLQKLQGITPMIHQESIKVSYKEQQYTLPYKREQAPKEVWTKIHDAVANLFPDKSDKSINSCTGMIWYKWMPKNGLEADDLNDDNIAQATKDLGFGKWRQGLESLHEQVSPADEVVNINDPESPGLPHITIPGVQIPLNIKKEFKLQGMGNADWIEVKKFTHDGKPARVVAWPTRNEPQNIVTWTLTVQFGKDNFNKVGSGLSSTETPWDKKAPSDGAVRSAMKLAKDNYKFHNK